eukprot:1128667-Rhodomonas_salina.1
MFHRDCFPYRKQASRDWQPLEITETPDKFTTQEGGELMCRQEFEPYVMNDVRTRARVAAAQAEHQAQQDRARVEEENKEPAQRREAPRIDPAEQIAREQAAIEQLAEEPGGAYLD